jgi:2-methylisocitrate lyase-like PEP mutase family enzyme
MLSQIEKAHTFRDLHIAGKPVILFNIWDPGSAITVAGCGAKVIATGSHGVANANGYEDGEKIPFDLALANTRRVVEAVELPVSMDIETGYGADAAQVAVTVKAVIQAGVVGINFEDQIFESKELRVVTGQVERLSAARKAAEAAEMPLFINARSDLFKNADPSEHNADLLDQALERAKAYADAGADGFFLPGIVDLELIRSLCAKSPLPVNIIAIPGAPSTQSLSDAGVARISYGPVPYLQMIEWLKVQAAAALR